MRYKVVRIFSWISAVFYSLMALVMSLILIYEKLDIYAITTLVIFVGMAFTGWNTRKFGLIDVKRTQLKTLTALFSLFCGCFLAIFSPYIFASTYGLGDSYEPVIVLIIMFLPSVITSIAILIKSIS